MERFVDIPILNPVPETVNSRAWKNIPIKECGEPLVPLNNLNADLITIVPQYFKQGIAFAKPIQYARASVAEKLLRAAKLLPNAHKLIIWDAWRPLEVQQALFDSFVNKLTKKHPAIRPDEIKEMAQTYVSLPSKDPLKPSPHFTGGAVDLTVVDFIGIPLDMGTEFDHFGPEAATRYYEDNNLLPVQAYNRRLLYHAMTKAGFSSYDEEWWHFDYGNQFDAARTRKPWAIYGCPIGPLSISLS